MSERINQLEFEKSLESQQTVIDGLVVYNLPVHGDNRGWFKENWQREKMNAIGLPDFGPVQNNISFNNEVGVTRGLHAEPWDKYVSIGSGSVFGAWCDIRKDSPTFGKTFTTVLDPSKAIFIPRGVANGFQTLEDNTVYTYLVNDHWRPDAQYSNVSIFDSSLGIDWPIPLPEATISEKDHTHPTLDNAIPIEPKKTLITGADGQLGQALRHVYPDAEFTNRHTLDITSDELDSARHWREYGLIVNAAAYTSVDYAETPTGKVDAWRVNAEAVARLARIAGQHGITLVHISSDYVFDGSNELHAEEEPVSPLGVYGQSKAAGDIAAANALRHYIVRTSWVVGEGNNFIKTMEGLAKKGVKPSVVNDQVGRLTFTETLADGIKHLVDTKAPFSTYNLSNDGEPASWATIAKRVFELSGHAPDDVTGVSTEQYYQGKDGVAPRPHYSTLDLNKIRATGFEPKNWEDMLVNYVSKEEN